MATSYMNLVLPVVGPMGTDGPEWAELINAAQITIDSHDHSTGKGKSITPAGLNINQTLEMNSNSLSEILTLAIQNLSVQPSDSNLIYEFGGELFFNDLAGNMVQLTSNGAINVASLGTITGDYSTSSADLTYSDLSKTFIFKQDATKTASVDHGPMKIYRNEASSPYTLFELNAAQSGNITRTLLSALPASTLPLKVSAAGVESAAQIITGEIADTAITAAKMAANSVATASIVDASVTTAKINDGAVTTAKRVNLTLSPGSVSTFSTSSASTVPVTGLSVTITASGTRPIAIVVVPFGGFGGIGQISATGATAGQSQGWVLEVNKTAPTTAALLQTGASVVTTSIMTSETAFTCFDQPVAGSHTYQVYIAVQGGTTSVQIRNTLIYAYEI